jgi:adenosylmethionine-8-amino-7-oxononanoate aminotransferase
VAFANGYHGDTLGAASLGGVGRFFDRFRGAGYPVRFVRDLLELKGLGREELGGVSAVVVEPLVQGVNGMRLWPAGMLAELRAWCDAEGVHLILDEVMTGFGRTGTMFACEREGVVPDFLCLAKGLTGGTLPLAATLTREGIYEAFLGGEERAFYYGHSYTAHPAGCAAALRRWRRQTWRSWPLPSPAPMPAPPRSSPAWRLPCWAPRGMAPRQSPWAPTATQS